MIASVVRCPVLAVGLDFGLCLTEVMLLSLFSECSFQKPILYVHRQVCIHSSSRETKLLRLEETS